MYTGYLITYRAQYNQNKKDIFHTLHQGQERLMLCCCQRFDEKANNIPAQLFTWHAFFSLSQLKKKNQSLLTQICGQQLRNPRYRGVCPSQLTDHHRIVGKAMFRWAQANSPTLHLPFLVTTTQLQLFIVQQTTNALILTDIMD